jgi:hypothetical protein
MKRQDKIIKIDSFLRTNSTTFEWEKIEEDENDVFYGLVLNTDLGELNININLEDTPYTLITCISDEFWDDEKLEEYFYIANDWMLSSDILRVIVESESQMILFSYTYTSREDFFDAESLFGMADNLIQKVLEVCLPALSQLQDETEKEGE